MIGGTFFDEPLRWLHNYYLYRSTGLHWIDLPVDDVTVSVDEGTSCRLQGWGVIHEKTETCGYV